MSQPDDPFKKQEPPPAEVASPAEQPPEQGGYPAAPPPEQSGYPAAPPPEQGGYPPPPPPPQQPGGYQQQPPPGGYQQPPPGGYQQPGGYPPAPGGYQQAQPTAYPQQPQQGYPGAQPPVPGGYPPAPPQGYAGYGPPGTYFDPESGLNLPNGTRLANPGKRVGTYFLEILLFIVTLGIGYLIWMFIAWTRGQSPGKQLVHMRVYKPVDGRIARFGTMALRQIVGGIVEGLVFPIIQIVSLIMMITGKEHKAIHDYIASTVVLDDPNDLLAPT